MRKLALAALLVCNLGMGVAMATFAATACAVVEELVSGRALPVAPARQFLKQWAESMWAVSIEPLRHLDARSAVDALGRRQQRGRNGSRNGRPQRQQRR